VSRGSRRYYRTIALGVAAMAALIWAAMDQFGISSDEIKELLLATVLVVLAIILLAAVFAAIWIGIRRFLRDDSEPW
tara:strand:- start:208 stop:438 length:231 start_codon:yes stop_codon:yes gene_type:complete